MGPPIQGRCQVSIPLHSVSRNVTPKIKNFRPAEDSLSSSYGPGHIVVDMLVQ